MKYSFPKIVETLAAGRGLVAATIVEAEGSTPQVPGATAVFSATGLVAGTVGGGLLEARVEAAAGLALGDGKARLLTVRLDADPADLEGAICGGSAVVLVDPGVGDDRAVFERALEGFRKRRPGRLVTEVRPGTEGSVAVERRFEDGPEAGGGGPRLIKGGEGRVIFVEPVTPLPRLVIAGAGHVGRAVARLGAGLDFVVTVIDDRPDFANAAGVPEADEIVVGGIGMSLAERAIGPEDFVVIVTRGHEKDAEALRAVIGRPAAYIGMIGSKTKVGLMRRAFLEKGWAKAEEWDRVRAPIGLAIGSKTVEEIAVSIAAELVQVRAGRAAKEAGGR